MHGNVELRLSFFACDSVVGVVITEVVVKQHSDDSMPLWLNNLDCQGSERTLLECSRDHLGVHRENCMSEGHAGLKCLSKDPQCESLNRC